MVVVDLQNLRNGLKGKNSVCEIQNRDEAVFSEQHNQFESAAHQSHRSFFWTVFLHCIADFCSIDFVTVCSSNSSERPVQAVGLLPIRLPTIQLFRSRQMQSKACLVENLLYYCLVREVWRSYGSPLEFKKRHAIPLEYRESDGSDGCGFEIPGCNPTYGDFNGSTPGFVHPKAAEMSEASVSAVPPKPERLKSKFCKQCGGSIGLAIPEGEKEWRHVCDKCGFVDYMNPKMVNTNTYPTLL